MLPSAFKIFGSLHEHQLHLVFIGSGRGHSEENERAGLFELPDVGRRRLVYLRDEALIVCVY